MDTTKMKHLGRLALLGAGVSLGAANAATVNGQEYVYLVSPDTSSAVGQNSFVQGTNWSDGEAPSAGKDCIFKCEMGKVQIEMGKTGFRGGRRIQEAPSGLTA